MRASLLAIAALAAGCDERGRETAEPPPSVAAAPAKSSAPAAPREEAGEVQLDALLGIWRVVGVAPGPAATFGVDDARIVGSLMDVQPAALSWSYKASAAFAPKDLCLGPVSGMTANAEAAARARALLASAVARQPGARLSRPHAWLCGDGGSWGDDADFQVLGPDRIAMAWPGDLVLTLERIRRVAKDPPPLPPTGAFQDR